MQYTKKGNITTNNNPVNEILLNMLKTQYENLLLTVDISESKKRKKKGLIDGIGTLQKWLFGTADVTDVNAIQKLLTDNTALQELLKRRIQITNHTVNQFAKDAQTFRENDAKISENLLTISTIIDEIINHQQRNDLKILVEATETQLLSQTILFQNEMNNLQDAILFAKLNIALRTSLQNAYLPAHEKFPILYTEKLSQIEIYTRIKSNTH
ncbi:hypothetical protein PGB90_007542 [Kerria lacca]